ncbi:MAG TPA: hypothetical protein V6D07_18660 [Trichocoleus sp.]
MHSNQGAEVETTPQGNVHIYLKGSLIRGMHLTPPDAINLALKILVLHEESISPEQSEELKRLLGYSNG